MGLSSLLNEDPLSIGLSDGTESEPLPPAADDDELAALIAREAASLKNAYDHTNPTDPAHQSTDDPSTHADAPALSQAAAHPNVTISLRKNDQANPDKKPLTTTPTATPTTPTAPGAGIEPSSLVLGDGPENQTPSRIDDLFVQLDAAMGQKLATSSEPFKTAIAMIALATAQGKDPESIITPDSPVGQKLSPSERNSVQAVANLLGSLLASDANTPTQRTQILDRLQQQIAQNLGVTIPKAVLCTRVQGFGKYQPFGSTNFLAGQSIRALVYVEVDHFKHKPMNNTKIGGFATQDRWSVEISQELQLLHKAEGRLAWRRPAEKVIETSRNKQRDFYLLTEIELPPTLSIGSYQLKVIVHDDVGDSRAEVSIPIGIVADPALAWQEP